MKILCPKCKIEKELNRENWKMYKHLCKNGDIRYYRLRKICLECFNKDRKPKSEKERKRRLMEHKIWREENKDRQNLLARERLKKNSAERNAKRKELYSQNEKLRKQNVKRVTEFRRKNIWYRINNIFSSRIRDLIRDKNRQSTVDIIGYSLKDLTAHLEKLFTPDMSWENYGKFWHIDHIKPVSSFDFKSKDDPDFKKCWALENLRPLEAWKNLQKGAKLDSGI